MDLVGLFSGGKDSMTASHVSKVKEVIFCHTGIGLNEDFVKTTCKDLGWKLNIVYPKHDDEYERFIEKFGFPKPTNHTWIMHNLKSKPIRAWYNKEKHLRDIEFVSGIRRQESRRRMKIFKRTAERSVFEKMTFNSPIISWNHEKVAKYIKKHNLPIAPFYETLGLSGDCMCGAYNHKGEAMAINKNYPELAERIKGLEKKYRDSWGRYTSITACTGQRDLEGFICNECMTE